MIEQRTLSKMKNDFINNLAHEIKTPVFSSSVILKMMHKMKADENGKVREYIDLLSAENSKLKNQIKKVLDLAQLEHGTLTIDAIPTHINKLIEDNHNTFRSLCERKGGSVTLKLNAKNDVANVDVVHFSNVIFNIVDNGLNYNNRPPEIVIKTRNKDNQLFVEVEDNGVGIDPKYFESIFSKFFRIESASKKQVAGYGVGLSYVKLIIDLHQANIDVTSTLGKGSTFIINIPVI